ncbi:hypothetical protein GCM10012276_18770 [Nocardioides deserti]|nr:hypothetical protein GCM10012276_18770 [Nocardioides deserti]
MVSAGLSAGLTIGLLAAAMPAASADADLAAGDAKKDAHPALDITRVEVFHSRQAVKVLVRVRDYAGMDSGAKVATALGVHFDTRGNGKPEHLIKIDGMHIAAGSTSDWNRMRPNGIDPWGDWTDCYPDGWDKPLIRSKPQKDKVVFLAPRTCLGDPNSVRVAVQSYKPYRSKTKADWARGVRRYIGSVELI